MNRSHKLSIDPVDDEDKLILLVTIPSLLLICLLPLFGFWRLAVALIFIVFIGAIPLMTIFIDTYLNENEIEDAVDPVEELRERYIAGELSEVEFERAVERELEDDDRPLDMRSDRGKSFDHELEPES